MAGHSHYLARGSSIFGLKYMAKPKSASWLIQPMSQLVGKIKRLLARTVAGTVSYVIVLLAFPSGPFLLLLETVTNIHRHYLPSFYGSHAFIILGGLTFINVIIPLLFFTALKHGKSFRALLSQYRLHDELGSSYTLKQYLTRLFDRGYYGKFNITDTVGRALGQSSSSADAAAARR